MFTSTQFHLKTKLVLRTYSILHNSISLFALHDFSSIFQSTPRWNYLRNTKLILSYKNKKKIKTYTRKTYPLKQR